MSTETIQISSSPAASFLSFFSLPPSNSPLSPPAKQPDDEGEVVGNYTLGEIIGSGAFSTVRRGYSKDGDVVAVKIVKRNTGIDLDRETAVWESLSHEHILPLFSSHHTAYASFFVTLLCSYSLYDLIKLAAPGTLERGDAGMMFRQVVRGVRYLHEVKGLVHGDLKAENVLVDEAGQCRIGDFGMCRPEGEVLEEDDEDEETTTSTGSTTVKRTMSMSMNAAKPKQRPGLGPAGGLTSHPSLIRHHPLHQRRGTNVHPSNASTNTKRVQPGSLPYAAPEILSPSGSFAPHFAQDIWALGILLHLLLTSRLAFADSFEPRLLMKILNGVWEMPSDLGKGEERVLRGCLEREESRRWTIGMLDEVAWGVGWGDVEVEAVDEEELRRETSRSVSRVQASRSRSKSRGFDMQIPDSASWEHDPMRSAASHDVASRRSLSRARRSLSRAPALTDEGSTERSRERFERKLVGESFTPIERGRRLQKTVAVVEPVQLLSSSRTPSPRTPDAEEHPSLPNPFARTKSTSPHAPLYGETEIEEEEWGSSSFMSTTTTTSTATATAPVRPLLIQTRSKSAVGALNSILAGACGTGRSQSVDQRRVQFEVV